MQALLARIASFRVPQSRGVSSSRLIRDQNAAALAAEVKAEKPSFESEYFSQQECTAVNGWDCVVLGESPRGPPWILVQGENVPLWRTQAWKKQNTLRSVGPPFTFTRCDKPDRPELRQQPSPGMKMLQALGLEQFLETPIPEFDAERCNAFISSYAPPYGYGIVEGRPVKITVSAMARLTRLPLGSWRFVGHMKGNRIAILQGMLPTLEVKKPRLYSLEELRFGGDEAESRAFVAVAGLLMERLICKPHPPRSAMGPLLLAMHGSLRLKMQLQWARLITSRMRKAAEHAKMDNTPFFYGEWLSGLIRQELSAGGGDRRDELKVEGAARCNLESSLKDLARLEAVLDSRLQGLNERENC